MTNSKPVTFAVAGIAAVLIAAGAYSLGHSDSDSSSTATTAAAQVPQQGSQLPQQGGQLPQNGQAPPGFGTPATGAAARKAEAAALAKYDGTAERVMKLDDGSYVVHVITSNGEYHVAVSKAFQVTGADQGGPGGGPGPSASGTSS